ncbi:MAG TPA: hypothetical protein VK335_04035 [Bryobacteraceae bacterium]|nr:hypothetical protein [Bryobacteraceae bacterium]
MSEIGHGRRRRFLPRLAGGVARHHRLLHARLLKLEAGDTSRAIIFGLGKMLEGFADSFVIALAMIAAAEVFIEEPPQRPEIFSAILAAQKRRLPSSGFHYIGKIPQLKTFSDQILGRTMKSI